VTDVAVTRDGSLTLERDGPVALITLRRADQRNALDGALAVALVDALDEVRKDYRIGALVLAADGPAFCSGGNLDLLARAGADPTAPAAFDELGSIYRVFEVLTEFPVPTVAAAQGAVVGAGINLLLAADIAVVAEDVSIRGFGAAGVHPGGGHLSLLLRKAPAAAAAVALFGRTLGAAEAVRTGIAWCAVPPEQLLAAAVDLAQAGARDPELARAVTRTYRAEELTRPTPQAAVLIERAPQMWSLRRAQLRRLESDT
jgi:enoyl-CoA hydratase